MSTQSRMLLGLAHRCGPNCPTCAEGKADAARFLAEYRQSCTEGEDWRVALEERRMDADLEWSRQQRRAQ